MTKNDSCSCDGEGCPNCDILLGDIDFNSDKFWAGKDENFPHKRPIDK